LSASFLFQMEIRVCVNPIKEWFVADLRQSPSETRFYYIPGHAKNSVRKRIADWATEFHDAKKGARIFAMDFCVYNVSLPQRTVVCRYSVVQSEARKVKLEKNNDLAGLHNLTPC